MLKIKSHGNTISVMDPVKQKETEMVNIVFTEDGRSGADGNMSKSSDILSRIAGVNVGLDNTRTHTQPVRKEHLKHFAVGSEIPGFINRGMYSKPQLRGQIGVDAREIDGKPTYFKTWIAETPEEDVDFRISNDVLAASNPKLFFGARVGGTQVRVIAEPVEA